MKRWGPILALMLVVTAALVLRCGDLAGRPLHNDEAINAFKFRKLWTAGEFRYDPHEYHGPTLYYLTLPMAWVGGRLGTWAEPDERVMRALAVVAGMALLMVGWLAREALGVGTVVAGAALAAVSPVMVYYSRYYIHELLLVLFTALTLMALWRYLRQPSAFRASMVGVGVALMYATKETFVFSVAAAIIAGVGVGWLHTAATAADGWRGRVRAIFGPSLTALRKHGLWMAAAFALVFVTLFSSFFTNPSGPVDAFKTYWIWGERAGGASPHIHPWGFYFERLAWFQGRNGPAWSEVFVLAWAVIGAAYAMWRSGGPHPRSHDVRPIQFLLFYTAILAAVYSCIPYKTPWCLLGFYHGVLLLAGYGVVSVWRSFPSAYARLASALVLLAGAGHLAWQSHRATGDYAADFRNPWVYGHTSADLLNLLEQVREVSAAHPDARRMPVQVMAPESAYWPLPWYLRDFERVGWWDHVPEEPLAPMVVTASRLNAQLEEKTNRAWRMVGLFELRPRFFVELNVEAGLWAAFLDARARARAAETQP